MRGRDLAQPFQWARSFSFPFRIVERDVDENSPELGKNLCQQSYDTFVTGKLEG